MYKIDKDLDSSLRESGFKSYPSQANKYYSQSGKVIWTEGSWYKDGNSSDWKRFDHDKADLRHKF